uniref:Uncharacterized protein n=1 Tax=Parascaris equorum TaxID=6256 RepID=A0A914RK10_PAREQ
TLANLVRQLSSLSRHAEHIFGEIYHEVVKLDHKTNTLSQRIERLTHKVTQLDCTQEQESLCRYIAATQQRPSDIMHFPAEYQAPQIVRMEQVQAPAGMSVPTSNGYTAPPAAAPTSINLPSPIPEADGIINFNV